MKISLTAKPGFEIKIEIPDSVDYEITETTIQDGPELVMIQLDCDVELVFTNCVIPEQDAN